VRSSSVLGLTTLARSKAGSFRSLGRVEEAHLVAVGLAARAAGRAVEVSGEYPVEKYSLEAEIST